MVFKAVNKKNKIVANTPLAIKFTKDEQTFSREAKAIKQIKASIIKNTEDGSALRTQTPSIVQMGQAYLCKNNGRGRAPAEELNSYIVMSRYGKDLETYFQDLDYKVSQETVYNLGFKLINIIEQVHNAGLIYNDLKLANVLVGYNDKLPKDCSKGNALKDVSVNLIDFGMVSKYMDRKTGEHLQQKNLDCFYGNLLFSSAH